MSFTWFVAAFIAAGVVLGTAVGVAREILTDLKEA